MVFAGRSRPGRPASRSKDHGGHESEPRGGVNVCARSAQPAKRARHGRRARVRHSGPGRYAIRMCESDSASGIGALRPHPLLPLSREKVAPWGVERRPSLDGLWRRMRGGANHRIIHPDVGGMQSPAVGPSFPVGRARVSLRIRIGASGPGLDHDLHRIGLGIRGHIDRFHRLLQAEPMRHQPRQVITGDVPFEYDICRFLLKVHR